jgi:hypothetical protein
MTMPPHIWHFSAWWMVLAAFPLAWALRADSQMRRDERVYRLTFVVGPVLLGVIWLHGLLFNPPDNWARSDALNFFGFWFRPHDLSFYVQHQQQLVAFAAPGVLMAALLTWRGARAIEYAWNRRTAAISYGLQVGAWLLLRQLPDALIELGERVDWRSIVAAAWADALSLALAVLIPLPLIAFAYLFERQSVEARRPKAV